MSGRGRKQTAKFDASAFTPEAIRKRLEKKNEVSSAYQTIKQSKPNQTNVSELLSWAFLQAEPPTVIKAIQILHNIGHFGQKLVLKLVADMDITSSEREQIGCITEQLIPIQKHIYHLARKDVPIAIVTHKTVCNGCDIELATYNAKITDVTLYQPLKKSVVKLIRMYCKNCNRSYSPWSIDKGKRSSVKRKVEGMPVLTERMYYNWNEVRYVEGNERNYFSKEFCEQLATLLLHCWVSAQGFSEAFTEAMHNLEIYAKLQPSSIPEIELERRLWGKTYMEYEIWMNLLQQRSLNTDADLKRILDTDKYLTDLDLDHRAVYEHVGTEKCEQLGCQWMAICDGNWKNKYTLCMFQELKEGPVPNVSVPQNCKNQPENRSKAFCSEHGAIMQAKGYPTELREFLGYCKSKHAQQEAFAAVHLSTAELVDAETEETFTFEEEIVTESDHSTVPTGPQTRSMKRKEINAVEAILKEAGEHKVDNTVEGKLVEMVDLKANEGKITCSKDTGGKKVMNCWSRGHFYIVSPCGQILRWAPLYGSESPSQAFINMVEHLCSALKDIPVDDWYKYSIVYDNMCNVDKMRAAKNPLPTSYKDGSDLYPTPFNQCWLKCNKAIDKLHLSNHKDPKCRTDYNPEKIKEMHPKCTINTMRAEETFVWLSRYKKILCAMPKTNHLFFLYRLILRRNAYTKWKLEVGKNVVLPKARSAHTT